MGLGGFWFQIVKVGVQMLDVQHDRIALWKFIPSPITLSALAHPQLAA